MADHFEIAAPRPCGPADPPLVLRLFTKRDTNVLVRLTAEDCSHAPLAIAMSALKMPVELRLVGADAAPIAPAHDKRQIMKYDATVRVGDFVPLAPGQEIVLVTTSFAPIAGGYALEWESLAYEPLPAGRYALTASRTNLRTKAYDDDARGERPIPRVWTGTATSNEIVVDLR